MLPLLPHSDINIMKQSILSYLYMTQRGVLRVKSFGQNRSFIIYVRMSCSDRSTIFRPSPHMGLLTPRTNSSSTQKTRQKGISLSKELEPKKRSDSPSFIKLVQKGKKPQIVERREIKLILKVREQSPRAQNSFNKENQNIAINTGGLSSRGYMQAISNIQPVIRLDKDVNQNFPLKKPTRHGQRNCFPSIQLF